MNVIPIGGMVDKIEKKNGAYRTSHRRQLIRPALLNNKLDFLNAMRGLQFIPLSVQILYVSELPAHCIQHYPRTFHSPKCRISFRKFAPRDFHEANLRLPM